MAAKSTTKKVAGAGRGRPPADGKKKKKSTAKMLMSNSSAPKMTSDGIILQNLMNLTNFRQIFTEGSEMIWK